ncbi:hydroperoxide isomerase ALOXE3-like [Antennarius striatus]|uniref:hydroperoxide isomerase ALOXE3-like n=1 Tax=Antennarius striatus TaxID=241820 RepID=UPI0035B3AF5D
MAEYKLEVTTGNLKQAGTWDHIYVTLFGSKGQSDRTELDNFGLDFTTGAMGTYTIETSLPLGTLLLVKVEKDPFFLLSEDEWYFSKVVVMTPEGDRVLFPCYRWISRGELVELRGGRAMKDFEEVVPLLIEHRRKELTHKKSLYQWKTLTEGICDIVSFNDVSELPAEIRFTDVRETEILDTKRIMALEFKLKGLIGSTEQWENMEDMKNIFWCEKTEMSEYVTEHWKEDDFYGYQFLNGVNPILIKRCSELPSNFPVTEEMMKPFLEEGTCLQREIEKGHVFIYDQKKMDGISARLYNEKHLHVTPGLCLFYLNSESKLMPIAIQLHQQPSAENPIFLPSDLDTDWLLAKMFIKNADIMDHEAVHHLMNTHFLGEVLAVATLRCFPEIHPLYKLLFPNFRYTLPLNIGGRKSLFGPNGSLSKSSLGYDGILELMRRYFAEMTYSTLCLPESITSRGLESIPNFYYRDDGLKLWNIINSFVKEVAEYFYPSDSDVCKDTELQEWINEIFVHGFLGNKDAGFPACFHTTKEVIKFITMMIFTVTVQHAAVNNGQFDYYSWIPNAPLLLRKPPPTAKGQSSMESILETLPNTTEAVSFAAMAKLLSENFSDMVFLGRYPEERFEEPAFQHMVQKFQNELSHLGDAIQMRNSQLEIPYTYLHPANIENSIAR